MLKAFPESVLTISALYLKLFCCCAFTGWQTSARQANAKQLMNLFFWFSLIIGNNNFYFLVHKRNDQQQYTKTEECCDLSSCRYIFDIVGKQLYQSYGKQR